MLRICSGNPFILLPSRTSGNKIKDCNEKQELPSLINPEPLAPDFDKAQSDINTD